MLFHFGLVSLKNLIVGLVRQDRIPIDVPLAEIDESMKNALSRQVAERGHKRLVFSFERSQAELTRPN